MCEVRVVVLFYLGLRDLATQPVTTGASIVGAGAAAATSFSTDGNSYVGNYVVLDGGSSVVGGTSC